MTCIRCVKSLLDSSWLTHPLRHLIPMAACVWFVMGVAPGLPPHAARMITGKSMMFLSCRSHTYSSIWAHIPSLCALLTTNVGVPHIRAVSLSSALPCSLCKSHSRPLQSTVSTCEAQSIIPEPEKLGTALHWKRVLCRAQSCAF